VTTPTPRRDGRDTSTGAMATEHVLGAIAQLQDQTAGTPYETLVGALMDALADDSTVFDLRQEIEFLKTEKERLLYRIDDFSRRAEIAERGHKACLARERERDRG
jgi:hypothetical protein